MKERLNQIKRVMAAGIDMHIWFRVISCFLYPVTILYFLFTGRMIYDTLLSKENMS